jgi:hypothetical protein
MVMPAAAISIRSVTGVQSNSSTGEVWGDRVYDLVDYHRASWDG